MPAPTARRERLKSTSTKAGRPAFPRRCCAWRRKWRAEAPPAAVGAIDKLLSQWEQEGVSTPEQARARKDRPQAAKRFDNPALHYQQRAIEGDGDEMFTDLSQYRGDGV